MVLIITSLAACTLSTPVQVKHDLSEKQLGVLPAGKGWWYVRFKIDWPKEQPDWYMGALLAGEVIAPVLKKKRHEIELWRFHRRAAHDGADHVFSFIFYSSPQTARDIFRKINQDPLLVQLIREKKIIQVRFDNPKKITRPNIEDTSDPEWPLVIMKTWPTYIMGASQMWLDLVIELANSERKGQPIDKLYQGVQQHITSLWVGHGRHVWLHHLNALYAYHPLLMRY